MSSRARVLGIVLFALLLVGMHIDFKKELDPEDVRKFAEEISAPWSWMGRTAPDFEAETLDGKQFRLADEVGKRVVILNFFASWCEPCRQEMPELARFRASEAGKDVLFVGIDAAEERPAVEKFVRDFKVDYPVVVDHPGGVRIKYGVRSYPTTIVIGADGRIELYETSTIVNADVSLVAPVAKARQTIQAGQGIKKDAYLAALASEKNGSPTSFRGRSRSEGELTGRAHDIAAKMSCLCGCTNKLLDCSCKTASGMKKKLKDGPLDGKSDEEIMAALGKEFCMGGM
jgi:thiol-disulfide isomerase/thioredoxin